MGFRDGALNGESAKLEAPLKKKKKSRVADADRARNRRFLVAVCATLIAVLVIGLSFGLTGKTPEQNEQTPNDNGIELAPKFVVTSNVFNVSLPLFGRDLATSYESLRDLETDLTQVFKLYVNNIIQNNLVPQRVNEMPPPEIEFGGVTTEGGDNAVPSAQGETDHSTNNQEAGVDEADLVKSDGIFVYAAYGDVLVVWEAHTGDLVINVTFSGGGGNPDIFRRTTRPNIVGLLLASNRLVVILSGYGEALAQEQVLTLATRIVVYETSSLGITGTLVKIREVDIHGDYRDGRTIGDYAHIVTTAGLETYTSFLEPLSRSNQAFADMDDDEYREAAKKLAEDTLIPQYVQQLIHDITSMGTPNLAGVGVWQTKLSNNTGVEEMIYSNAPVVSAYTQVASFHVLDDAQNLALSLSGAFMPSSWGHTYATPSMLIFAAQGWDWISALEGTGETTYFMGFALDGATSKPIAVGSLPGYLLNPFSIDIHNGFLRVATTIRNLWVAVEPVGQDAFVLPVVEQTTQNQIVILEIPPLEDTTGVFQEVGRIPNLGKEFEVFTAVRFFDEIAYAVTFQRTDPFYVLNVTDARNPSALGELNITGFSSYLHSINDDDTLLVAVGQEADVNGRPLGVQVTLFDASDPQRPIDLHRYLVEQDVHTWSHSVVEWDYKAFRFLRLGVEVGLLILPLKMTSNRNRWENYDGFVVLDVSKQGISLRFNITHAEGEEFYGCYYWAALPQRSLVFNGNVTTLKGHRAISTDLDTGVQAWELDLVRPADQNECVYWR